MKTAFAPRHAALSGAIATCLGLLGSTASYASASGAPPRQAYIVEGPSTAAAVQAVRNVGATVTQVLPIIAGVTTDLSTAQAAALRRKTHITLFPDTKLATLSGTTSNWTMTNDTTPDIYQMTMVNSTALAAQGINGAGVTVAVVDSGIEPLRSLTKDLNGNTRLLAQYDTTSTAGTNQANLDKYGHGTHITSLIASSNTSSAVLNNQPQGIAPMVKLVEVKAFDANGQGSYSSVLAGLNWILQNQASYNIRVVNLSFGAPPISYYWNDPIDQAVMQLWQAGIVVVASAGNSGPSEQTINVPGNTPYVITVGAMTDHWTPTDPSDDGVASFSSAGPTVEGFIKPDVIAPGGHLAGLMDGYTQTLAKNNPQFQSDAFFMFIMSGTSQASAITTGVVALMLQANPTLSPDDVKCRLQATARAGTGANGLASYSIFQQGAGLINAYDATYSTATGCANVGLNVVNDIAGTAHYAGPAQQNATTGQFYIVDASGKIVSSDGFLWNKNYVMNQGFLWNKSYLWNKSAVWNQGFLWNKSYLWNKGFLWNKSTLAPSSTPTATESWNNQE